MIIEKFTLIKSSVHNDIPLVNTAQLSIEYMDDAPSYNECPFPFEEFTGQVLLIEDIPEGEQVLLSIEKRFKVPALLPNFIYFEKGIVSKAASSLYAKIYKAHKTSTFKSNFRAFVKTIEFNLTYVPGEKK